MDDYVVSLIGIARQVASREADTEANVSHLISGLLEMSHAVPPAEADPNLPLSVQLKQLIWNSKQRAIRATHGEIQSTDLLHFLAPEIARLSLNDSQADRIADNLAALRAASESVAISRPAPTSADWADDETHALVLEILDGYGDDQDLEMIWRVCVGFGDRAAFHGETDEGIRLQCIEAVRSGKQSFEDTRAGLLRDHISFHLASRFSR